MRTVFEGAVRRACRLHAGAAALPDRGQACAGLQVRQGALSPPSCGHGPARFAFYAGQAAPGRIRMAVSSPGILQRAETRVDAGAA